MSKLIRLAKQNGRWCVEWCGPERQRKIELCGGATFRTGFLDSEPVGVLIDELRRRNPGYTVEIAPEQESDADRSTAGRLTTEEMASAIPLDQVPELKTPAGFLAPFNDEGEPQ